MGAIPDYESAIAIINQQDERIAATREALRVSDMCIVWTKEQYDAILEDMRKDVQTLDAGIQAIVSMRNKGMLKIIETPLPAPQMSERGAGE